MESKPVSSIPPCLCFSSWLQVPALSACSDFSLWWTVTWKCKLKWTLFFPSWFWSGFYQSDGNQSRTVFPAIPASDLMVATPYRFPVVQTYTESWVCNRAAIRIHMEYETWVDLADSQMVPPLWPGITAVLSTIHTQLVGEQNGSRERQTTQSLCFLQSLHRMSLSASTWQKETYRILFVMPA